MSTPAKPSPDERAEKALVLARRLAERAYPPLEEESVTRISLRLVAQEVLAESAAALLQAEEALAGAMIGMNGGSDNAFCHNGICSRAVCVQCQRKDAVSVALATIRELIGREEGA